MISTDPCYRALTSQIPVVGSFWILISGMPSPNLLNLHWETVKISTRRVIQIFDQDILKGSREEVLSDLVSPLKLSNFPKEL